MTKEVEDIIRNKAYIELSNEEKANIEEWAPNEDEFNNLKWFLTGTADAFSEQKITASPDLRKGVMEHLTESKKRRGFWMNTVGVFMLPEGKKFYQQPGFQLGMAAVAVIGFLFFFNRNGLEDQELAINDVQENPIEEVTVVDQSNVQEREENSGQLLNETEEIDMEEEVLSLADEDVPVKLYEQLEAPAEEMVVDQESEIVHAPPVMDFAMEDAEVVDEIAESEPDYNWSANEADKDIRKEVATNADEGVVVMSEKKEDRSLFRRDRNKNKAATAMDVEKMVVLDDVAEEQDEELNLNGVYADSVNTNNVVSAATTAGATNLGSSQEWIQPKSLHINKTKELNQLFYIEK